jgi:hypothetical protein
MAGFIYVMSNPSFIANLIKIGKSDKDPTQFRAAELASTGVPDEFVVEYFAFAVDHHALEKSIHERLKDCRRNQNREFFLCSIPEAIETIRKIGKNAIKYEEVVGRIKNDGGIALKAGSIPFARFSELMMKTNMGLSSEERRARNAGKSLEMDGMKSLKNIYNRLVSDGVISVA